MDFLAHVDVAAAMARLATQGGWARMMDRKPLEDELDIADAELLVAAEILRKGPADTYEPIELHPWYLDPPALAGATLSHLRRALHHAEGAGRGWSADDLDAVRDHSVGSRSAATILAGDLLPMLATSHAAFVAGRGRFLDVGVGAAAVAQRLCELYDGATAVGLDVLRPVLDLAARDIAAAGLGDRIELRHQSVAQLDETAGFDLAWVPQPYIPRSDLMTGLERVGRALRPGCWLVMPIADVPDDLSTIQQAARRHEAQLSGGGPLSVDAASDLLSRVGFDRVRAHRGGAQTLMLASVPPSR